MFANRHCVQYISATTMLVHGRVPILWFFDEMKSITFSLGFIPNETNSNMENISRLLIFSCLL